MCIRDSPHPFRVTAGQSIVGIEGRSESEDLLRSHDGLVDGSDRSRLLHSTSEIPCVASLAGHGETFWRLVRKDHGHLEQDRERQRSPGEPVGAKENNCLLYTSKLALARQETEGGPFGDDPKKVQGRCLSGPVARSAGAVVDLSLIHI